MPPLRFYEHFAVAYGTIWLALLAVALLTASNIDAGGFGLFGFPILAVIYAFGRWGALGGGNSEVERLRQEVEQLRRKLQARDLPN